MLKTELFVALLAATGLLWCPAGQAASSADFVGQSQCAALANEDLSALADAPTKVTGAQTVEATTAAQSYCEVRGDVAPRIRFLMLLPDAQWNGKFLELGCGGFCGSDDLSGASARLARTKEFSRGYALLAFGIGDDTRSALWAYNDITAQFDFGIRAAHVVALAGKALIERHYGRAPAKSYFSGCSTGGAQALSEAQRFPWDFDGIISGAPSTTFSGPMMNYAWAGRWLAGRLDRASVELLHAAMLARCDMDDGVKDGVISDPWHCSFDPSELSCNSTKTTNCLTPAQVQAVKQVYSGPTTSNHEKIYTGGPLPGSELNWIADAGIAPYVDSTGAIVPWSHEYFAYVGFVPAPGQAWRLQDFNFDRDYKRLRMAESVFGAVDNPDLRGLKNVGGKLIMYQGLQDQSDIPADAIDYYETAEKTLGGRSQTQSFLRLFVIPGMNHCYGGPGAFDIDYMKYLEAWVEQGHTPEVLIGTHLDETHTAVFTRPIYPYPFLAKYRGTGNPNDAASFVPVSLKK